MILTSSFSFFFPISFQKIRLQSSLSFPFSLSTFSRISILTYQHSMLFLYLLRIVSFVTYPSDSDDYTQSFHRSLYYNYKLPRLHFHTSHFTYTRSVSFDVPSMILSRYLYSTLQIHDFSSLLSHVCRILLKLMTYSWSVTPSIKKSTSVHVDILRDGCPRIGYDRLLRSRP